MKVVQFIAIVLTAVALIPGGAHLAERSAKMTLDQQQYITVQSIYRGWALFGFVLGGAPLAIAAVAFLARNQRGPLTWAAIAALLLAALVTFFIWTFPTNQVTNNWTEIPEHWEAQRTQWEYSHAVNAALTFLALCSIVIASLTWSE